jgi:hypothetical protein
MAGYDELLGEVFAGREPTSPRRTCRRDPRQPAHGAVEQVRLARAHHRQQVRDVGRLLDALRRQRGRLRVIKDVPKLLVYRLVAERARRDPESPVPESIVTRAPSAELRPDQRDEDSLPPYEVLDAILEGYVEQDLGREQLIARGLPAADVDRVIRLVDLSEYKRRQNPPGIKLTSKAFGRDRRVPIVNRYGG